jgi:hypothetical protein
MIKTTITKVLTKLKTTKNFQLLISDQKYKIPKNTLLELEYTSHESKNGSSITAGGGNFIFLNMPFEVSNELLRFYHKKDKEFDQYINRDNFQILEVTETVKVL